MIGRRISIWGQPDRPNWLTIVGGIAIGLGGIAGWRYWQSHSARQGEQAEGAYTAVLEALGANKREDAVTRAVGAPAR